jgi:diguanylate cyclase (GGDEF)-like protein
VPGEEPKGRFLALATMMGARFEENLTSSVHQTDLHELLMMTQTYIQNTATDNVKLFPHLTEEQELPSIICLPIMNQEERLGTLVVGKNRINAFMDSRAFYENIASQLSIGIANARLYAKMNDMAIRDGLTRIYNRRHLTDILNEYLSEAVARKVPVSMALFDIDKFKSVNDTYGHQCGDEVLRHVASVLNQEALAWGGIVGRYGGEEFVVAFLGKNLDETYTIIQRMHQKIKDEVVTYEDKTLQVRASAGIASYPYTCENPSELLTRADYAMYHSKKTGRDRITIDSEEIRAGAVS